MGQDYRVLTELVEDPPEGAVGVLFAIPPTTADQTIRHLEADPSWEAQAFTARGSGQSALFVKCSQGRPPGQLRLEVGPGSGKIVDQHFVARAGQSTDPQDDARKVFADLEINNALHERERLRRIVDCISAKYQYQHDFRSDEPLTCDLLTGNCLDINAALVKLLRLAGIRHAYYIGYFFEEGQSIGGRHCWVSTIADGIYENWDIAHHLKRNVLEVQSALNPIPGRRFAMSTGWDLVFDLAGLTVEVEQLAKPRWIFGDGRSSDCQVTVARSAAPSQESRIRGRQSVSHHRLDTSESNSPC